MKIPYLFKTDIPEDVRNEYLNRREFKEDLILENIRRGVLLAIVVIAFETIFILIDIISCFLRVSKSFSFYFYLAMYLIMIAISLTYLLFINSYPKRVSSKAMSIFTVIHLTLIMVWGSAISLMDQRLYGQLIVFMVNMMICSSVYYWDAKTMGIPYLISTALLAIGLPFFQNSSDILIGHYANMAAFIAISWTTSRIGYRNYCDNYINKALMNRSNILLEKEMKENAVINKKLELANEQLKNLALLDELTELPNRRCFREFVEKMFQDNKTDRTVSVIMIDVDNFKQYNDLYGHEKGDSALIAVGKQLSRIPENTKQIAVRWGGEEFIFAAFDKSQEDIIKIADAIRLKVLELKIPNQNFSTNPYLTISLGTCTTNMSSPRSIGKIIDTADQAMYQAKKNGRNSVATLACNKISDREL